MNSERRQPPTVRGSSIRPPSAPMKWWRLVVVLLVTTSLQGEVSVSYEMQPNARKFTVIWKMQMERKDHGRSR
jgi:hypothetical protein